MTRAWPVLLLALSGCFDFAADAAFCASEGRCRDGGGGGAGDGGAWDSGTWLLPGPTAVACADGFCWENPFPHGYDYQSLHTPRPGEVWAVGGGTSVTRLRDGVWSFARPRDPSWEDNLNPYLRSIAVSDAGTVLALDDKSTLHQSHDGASWVSSGPLTATYPEWLAVNAQGFFVSGRYAYPTGGQGSWLARLDDAVLGTWTHLSGDGGDGANLKRVVAAGPDGVWAGGVGKVVQVASGALVSDEAAPGAWEVQALAPLPDGGVLVAGNGFCSARTGPGVWQTTNPGDDFTGAATLGGRTLLSTGGGELLSLPLGDCTVSVSVPLSGAALHDVSSNGTEAFIAGRRGVLVRVDADGGTRQLAPGSRATLAAFAAADGEAWAAGEASTLLRRTPSGWTQVQVGFSADFTALAALGGGRVALAGGALLGTLGDAGFRPATVEDVDGGAASAMADLRAFAQAGTAQVWAIGDGQVLRYLPDEGVWRRAIAYQPSAPQWSTGWASPDGTLWVGASGGALLRVSGGGTLAETVPGCDVAGLWGATADAPFIACADGKVFHRTGDSQFEALPDVPAELVLVTSLTGTGPEDLWVSGVDALARYRRATPAAPLRWEVVRLRTSQTTLHQARIAGGAVWAVGDKGTVARRDLP